MEGCSNHKTDVVVVGAGLSGLYIAALLKEANVDVMLLDSRGPNQYKRAAYLVSQEIAREWQLPHSIFRGRNRISGFSYYNFSGEVENKIQPASEGGFTPIPQRLLEQHLLNRRNDLVHYNTRVVKVSDKNSAALVHTNAGAVEASLVIDATGWQGNIMHSYYGTEDYDVVALYGGNFAVAGFDEQSLHFIRGGNARRNRKNWVFPLNSRVAEIVAAERLRRSDMAEWYQGYAQPALNSMIDIYATHGRRIDISGKSIHPLAFRVEPAGASFYHGLVVPFGEAGGLNSPSFGQLIDVLPFYARRLKELIEEAKQSGNWNVVGKAFHKKFMEEPPFLYLAHTIISEISSQQNGTLKSPNRYLIEAIIQTFDRDKQWKILADSGLTVADATKLFLHQPDNMLHWGVASIPALLSIARKSPQLYVQAMMVARKKIQNLIG